MMKSALTFGLWLWVMGSMAQSVTVTVRNPLTSARAGEMIEVDMGTLKSKLNAESGLIVTDADGKELPSQVTYDGKLIFQVGVAGKGKSVYYVRNGISSKYEPKVYGRYVPERADDIAWENEQVAFRTYGPALQRRNEQAFGFDIWNKRTSRFIIDERYANELDPHVAAVARKLTAMGNEALANDVRNAVSYHVDHGNGMDCYKVGATLGCGTPALLADGGSTIVYPWCWKEYKILDNGPLRFTFTMTYNPSHLNGTEVVETRTVSLDAGSQMNKCVVSYSGLNTLTPVCAGIVVHNENPTAYILCPENGYMGYEDLGDSKQYKEKYRFQNKDFGRIFVGAVFPDKKVTMKYRTDEGLPGAVGHILGVSSLKGSDDMFTYYFGTGWDRNKETGFQNMTNWEAYLAAYARQIRNPLKVTIK
ncbi:MAG: DUF4861 domain-containing protein [Bacteroidaceae bacterium]|nr:DUF4861 domain-containing protein [Bacteroidaceae bacterium]